MLRLLPPLLLAALGAAEADTLPDRRDGFLDLVACSPLGGSGWDRCSGVAITPDGTVVVAGNGESVLPLAPVPAPLATGSASAGTAWGEEAAGIPAGASGWLLRLGEAGRTPLSLARFPAGGALILRLRVGADGTPCILGRVRAGIVLPGAEEAPGEAEGGQVRSFVARLDRACTRIERSWLVPRARDLAVDGAGGFAVLGGEVLRYGADGALRWRAKPVAHGQVRPQAVAIEERTGLTIVTGYGMTHTGHEPYKDPFVAAWDDAGTPAWTLWNVDPKGQADAKKHGGTGLMADTTGAGVLGDGTGRIWLRLYADGGNSVCTRDPQDRSARRPMPPEVFAGVWQPGPGYGMKGAISTPVIFRADAASGRLEKGTWLSAWLPWGARKQANTLRLADLAADADGTLYAVGASACYPPVKDPWFAARPDEEGWYGGGGFLAVLDPGMRLLQAGAFCGSIGSLEAVAARGELVAVAGAVRGDGKKPVDRIRNPVWSLGAVQPWSGDDDGWVAVFRRTRPPRSATGADLRAAPGGASEPMPR